MADTVRWKDRYTALQKRVSRVKQASAKTSEASIGSALACLGGAGAGVLNSKWPTIKGQNTITAATLAGTALTILGLTESGGNVSAQLLDVGQGVLAGDIAVKTFLAAEKRKK